MLRAGLRLSDPADLALVSSSHSGEPMHVDGVRALLASGGLTEDDLCCPADLPLWEPARAAVLRAGGGPSRLYMNCSGKHAGMLLTCQAAGWSLTGYLEPDHPLQQATKAVLEDVSGETVAAVGTDGCGAPVLAISLTGLARSFLNLCSAAPGTLERAVADAMREHPDVVSGTDREDLALMRGLSGLLSKIGAEGVMAVALPGVGAVALKVDDGHERPRMPILAAALARLGVTAPILDQLAEIPILGGASPVGSVRVLPDAAIAGP
jgi:L-asparaginase II